MMVPGRIKHRRLLAKNVFLQSRSIPCVKTLAFVADQHGTWNHCRLTGNVRESPTVIWFHFLKFHRVNSENLIRVVLLVIPISEHKHACCCSRLIKLLRDPTRLSCLLSSNFAWLSKWSIFPSRWDLYILRVSSSENRTSSVDLHSAPETNLTSSISLNELEDFFFTCSSLLSECRMFPRCDWHSRGFIVLDSANTVVKPAFFAVRHLRGPSLQCFLLSHNRNVFVTGIKTHRHHLFWIPPYLYQENISQVHWVNYIGLYDSGLVTCRSDCLRETATLSEIVAVWSFIGSQGKDRRGSRQGQVRHDTWMTIIFWRHRDA